MSFYQGITILKSKSKYTEMSSANQSQLYKYRNYDIDFDGTRFVDKPSMTVEEFKTKEHYKTGVWTNPKNETHKQTYGVYIKKSIFSLNLQTMAITGSEFSWTPLKESDIIDFTNCPILKVVLLSPYKE